MSLKTMATLRRSWGGM